MESEKKEGRLKIVKGSDDDDCQRSETSTC